MNRETYLNKAAAKITKLFAEQGYEVPEINVSCSWPGGGGNKKGTIGQCWGRSASKAKINEIFISPVLDNTISVLDTLTHEMVHAIDDCKHGHRKEFTAIMRAIGLEGKPTSTHAGERLYGELEVIAKALGEYPHKKMTPNTRTKEKGRQLKASCKCGAIWRMSNLWLMEVKACPCCQSEDDWSIG